MGEREISESVAGLHHHHQARLAHRREPREPAPVEALDRIAILLDLAEDPVTNEALATFRFPGRPQATREIDFPIRFNRQCRPGASRPVRATYSVYPPP